MCTCEREYEYVCINMFTCEKERERMRICVFYSNVLSPWQMAISQRNTTIFYGENVNLFTKQKEELSS